MNTSQCAVYQVKEAPEYRNVRFRSYAKLKSEGKEVRAENYQQVYIGRIQPGEIPADIKTRLQKQRPKNFKGHSIGCSDVIVLTDDGKTTAYYVDKDGFIIVSDFFQMKNSSDTKLDVDTKGYTIEGKKGTWQVIDYILMNERKWYLMEHEEYGPRAAYVVLSDDGAVVMNDNYNGLDAEAREKIQSFLKQQEEKEQKTPPQQQTSTPIGQEQPPQQKRKEPELANWQKVMDNGEYLRSAEMAEEANYNMIDGLMNNVRKVKDKDKPRESVLAKLRLNQKKVAKQGKKQTQQKAMECGMTMTYMRYTNFGQSHGIRKGFYYCKEYDGKPGYCRQKVHEDLLKITVMDQIHNMIQAMCDRKVLLEKMKEGSYDKGELVSLRVRIQNMQFKLMKAEETSATLYENFATGLLDEQEYQMLREHYTEEKEKLETGIREAQTRKRVVEKSIEEFLEIEKNLEKYLDERSFNQKMIDELVEKIYVSSKGMIEIQMKCSDVFQKITEILE